MVRAIQRTPLVLNVSSAYPSAARLAKDPPLSWLEVVVVHGPNRPTEEEVFSYLPAPTGAAAWAGGAALVIETATRSGASSRAGIRPTRIVGLRVVMTTGASHGTPPPRQVFVSSCSDPEPTVIWQTGRSQYAPDLFGCPETNVPLRPVCDR